jgi:hypothetical protein
MTADLSGNHRSLNAHQKLLRFGQRQTQVRNIAKTFRPADLYQVGAQAAVIIAGRKQPQHPSHSRSPSWPSTRPIVPLVASSPILWTLPHRQTIGPLGRLAFAGCIAQVRAISLVL